MMYYAVCWHRLNTESYGKAWISIQGTEINDPLYRYRISEREWLTEYMYIVGPFRKYQEAEKYFNIIPLTEK